VASSITNSTYRRLSKTVSTWKKSHARIPSAWTDRTCHQVSPRGVALDRCLPV
jgi:hypothetical protein